MIIRDSGFDTMMQQQEEDKAQKLMKKEQRAMTSTPTGKSMLLVQRVLSLHYFLHCYVPQNVGVVSKVTTLEMDSMFFFVSHLLHLQGVFRVAGKMSLWT